MKTKFLNIALITFLSIAIIGCKKKADEAQTSEAEAAAVSEVSSDKYVTDVTKSGWSYDNSANDETTDSYCIP